MEFIIGYALGIVTVLAARMLYGHLLWKAVNKVVR